MNRSKGFTLIELVVVISILGILAAFAIPRFISLETEARTAATQGLAGSVRSATALAHGLWLAQNSPATVDMEGNTIAMTFGYPTAADIENTLVDFAGYNPTTAAGVTTFEKTGAPTPANCSVTYTEATGAAVPASIADDTSGC